MDEVIADYVAATKRALRAGFDMVELHAAHGYLLATFISPLTNKRTDAYGGPLANRMRFPLEVFRAMRAAWPDEKPMSVRISATDWVDGGLSGDDAVIVARMFAEAGCDLIDVSTGQTTPDAKPVYGRMYQTPFADQIRKLIESSFDHLAAHPDFILLLNDENRGGARHVRGSRRLEAMHSPLVSMVSTILSEGVRTGVFRKGINAVHLYISIAGLSYFYFANTPTLSAIFGKDLSSPAARRARRKHVVDLVMQSLRP
jgi:ribosome biogenesis protein Nip4